MLRVQAALPMFSPPVPMILQALQAVALVARHPLPDRFFGQQEKAADLVILVPLGHQNQRMIALPLMRFCPFIFIPPTGFSVIFSTEHSFLPEANFLACLIHHLSPQFLVCSPYILPTGRKCGFRDGANVIW